MEHGVFYILDKYCCTSTVAYKKIVYFERQVTANTGHLPIKGLKRLLFLIFGFSLRLPKITKCFVSIFLITKIVFR